MTTRSQRVIWLQRAPKGVWYTMDVTLDTTSAVVVGVADTRGTSLDRLAGEGARTAAESLRHVLPTDEAGRVPVAAFGSSI